MISRGLGL
jgi:hypothetical protein